MLTRVKPHIFPRLPHIVSSYSAVQSTKENPKLCDQIERMTSTSYQIQVTGQISPKSVTRKGLTLHIRVQHLGPVSPAFFQAEWHAIVRPAPERADRFAEEKPLCLGCPKLTLQWQVSLARRNRLGHHLAQPRSTLSNKSAPSDTTGHVQGRRLKHRHLVPWCGMCG